ncbi:MAG: Osc7112_2153 family protein [Microcoleus sp.]
MKRTILISSTILATLTVLGLSQASKSLAAPTAVGPTVNSEVEEPFSGNFSMRQCRDTNGGRYACPRFVLPQDAPDSDAATSAPKS